MPIFKDKNFYASDDPSEEIRVLLTPVSLTDILPTLIRAMTENPSALLTVVRTPTGEPNLTILLHNTPEEETSEPSEEKTQLKEPTHPTPTTKQ